MCGLNGLLNVPHTRLVSDDWFDHRIIASGKYFKLQLYETSLFPKTTPTCANYIKPCTMWQPILYLYYVLPTNLFLDKSGLHSCHRHPS